MRLSQFKKVLVLAVTVAAFLQGAMASPILDDHFDTKTVLDAPHQDGYWTWTSNEQEGVNSMTVEQADSLLKVSSTKVDNKILRGQFYSSSGSSDLNYFDSPIQITVNGFSADGTTSYWGNRYFYLAITPETGDIWNVKDHVSLFIRGNQKTFSFGCKMDGTGSRKNLVESTTLPAEITDFKIRLDETSYRLELFYDDGQGTSGSEVFAGTHGMQASGMYQSPDGNRLSIEFQSNSQEGDANWSIDRITVVPEPATAVLLAFGGLAAFVRKR